MRNGNTGEKYGERKHLIEIWEMIEIWNMETETPNRNMENDRNMGNRNT